MYSVSKILEMMAITGRSLGSVDSSIPRLASARRNVNCSWEYKGKVMRKIMADSEQFRRDLVDGVKIHFDNGGPAISALLIPDKERPLFHITTEGRDQAAADRIADEYEQKVIHWRDEP
jgi:mannose-1-phosphate guanylyltransferase/phosphomannomutase